MNSAQRATLAITTVIKGKIRFAVVGLAKLYEPSAGLSRGPDARVDHRSQ